jgi:hypothetical protein
MLGVQFPAAQFFITGVLGPGSNAHGPNEFLHLPTAERVTQCVSQVLQAHAVPHEAVRVVKPKRMPKPVAKRKRVKRRAR